MSCKPNDLMSKHDLDWQPPEVESDETWQIGTCDNCNVQYVDVTRLYLREKSLEGKILDKTTFDEKGIENKPI